MGQPVRLDGQEIGAPHGDVRIAFLHAAMSSEAFVWPLKKLYPDGKRFWKLELCAIGQVV